MRHLSTMIATVALLAGCGTENASGPHPVGPDSVLKEYRSVNSSNDIDFYAVKDNRKDPECFYTGAGGDLPPWNSSYKAEKVVVFLGNRTTGGPPGYRRWRLSPRAEITEQDLIDRLEANPAEADALIDGLNPNAFQPYNHTQAELEIGSKLGRASNPGDIIIPWYSEIIFVLKDKHETFNPKNPIRVVNNVAGSQSPFYKGPKITPGGKVLKVKYLSLPERADLDWDYIKKRDCIYYYELSLNQRHANRSGQDFEIMIVLDPDGGNGGGPRGDDPPAWP